VVSMVDVSEAHQDWDMLDPEHSWSVSVTTLSSLSPALKVLSHIYI
jgi:hypothetical protein